MKTLFHSRGEFGVVSVAEKLASGFPLLDYLRVHPFRPISVG